MSLFSSSNIGEMRSFKKVSKKMSQMDYYISKSSSAEALKLVSLGNKAFGAAIEDIVRECLSLGPRSSSQNDATFGERKIEIKAARYWAGKDDCKWQHLEPDHDYDLVLFCLMDFHELRVWAIKKDVLMGDLRERKIVTFQGKQGWWTTKKAIMPFLTPIQTVEDMAAFA